jgi:hypothetical protein
MANALYAAISTDTGSFQYPSTTARTYAITAELVSACAVGTLHPQDEQRLMAFNWRRFGAN